MSPHSASTSARDGIKAAAPARVTETAAAAAANAQLPLLHAHRERGGKRAVECIACSCRVHGPTGNAGMMCDEPSGEARYTPREPIFNTRLHTWPIECQRLAIRSAFYPRLR